MNIEKTMIRSVASKSLIEEDFPIKEVSEESVREKSIRHDHISTLHIWFARRPLAASRSTIFAALSHAIDDKDELQKRLNFTVQLSRWKNSLNNAVITEARKIILDSNDGKTPKVLDCFAGGGSIPLEASRLNCETYALELNPVAVLILKSILEYPRQFAKNQSGGALDTSTSLAEDFRKWADWVLRQARKEIGQYYPEDPNDAITVGYLWTRTIKCQRPSCGSEIPLTFQAWLSRKENKQLALKMVPDKKNHRINFRIIQGDHIGFDGSEATARGGTAICPLCGAGVDDAAVRKEAFEGRMGERLVATITHKRGEQGKTYRVSKDNDLNVYRQAEKKLHEKKWPWDFSAIPDEYISTPGGRYGGERGTFFVHLQMVLYGMTRWGDLFNSRQKLANATFAEKVRHAYQQMITQGYAPERAKAIATYLGLAVDRMVDYNSSICVWAASGEFVYHTLRREGAIPMAWDYFELNPFSESTGSWKSAVDWISRVINHLSTLPLGPCTVACGTATQLPYPNDFFDAVVTDPPYYDNQPYADLSDYFYVWLKRSIGNLYPDLFSTPLTPKTSEIIQNSSLVRRGSVLQNVEKSSTGIKDRMFFENEMKACLKEICRVLKPNGITVIVFAHKSTEAWETIIASLFDSGLVLTASWPVKTEMKTRMRAKESAVLASSIYMVCRKRLREKIGYFNDVKEEIESSVKQKLEQFWNQGIVGADFFVSAIGPAVEVFGRYSKVERLSGEEVSVKELLDHVRRVVSEYALSRILKKPDLTGVDATTRFYLLWRWTFNNAKVHFDDARKITQSVGGIELTDMWDSSGLVRKEKEFVRVLGPKDRVVGKEKSGTMIDVLHHAVNLWDKGDKKKLQEALEESGYSKNETFWQVAQAISDVLPDGDKEKQLIQGLIYGKATYASSEGVEPSTLLDFMKKE